MSTLKELISAYYPHDSVQTIASVLAPTVEIGPALDPFEQFFARMPGDSLEDHLKAAEVIQNPFPERSALDLSRRLREGSFDIPTERQVRAYLAQWERFTGEQLYNPSNHIPTCSTEQGAADFDTVSPDQSGRLRRADPFDLGDFKWGQGR